MRKDPMIFLRHILESIEKIEEYTRGFTEEKFAGSPKIQDAVLRNLEIIGEAAKNIPKDFTGKYPDVPW